MGGETVEEGRRILSTFGIPSFDYPDNAAWTFAMMWKLSKMIEGLFIPPRLRFEKKLNELKTRREAALKILEGPERLLSERVSKELLSLYGFSVVKAHLATTEKEACACAQKIGFPVVLKAEVVGVTHKTEIGGVELRLQDDLSVRKAFKKICDSVKKRFGEDTLVNVTVQKMIEYPGIELIVGSKRDAQFGQVILFGAGGIHVETFKDRSLGIPPLTSVLARNMIEKTKISRAFQTFYQGGLLDKEILENFLLQFSDMIIENPEIEECDINPLLVTSSGMFCLDARIITGNNIVENAILSYHYEYVREIVDNGKILRVRPVKPEDALLFIPFYERLSNLALYHDIFAFLPSFISSSAIISFLLLG
jgi:acetyltransferase